MLSAIASVCEVSKPRRLDWWTRTRVAGPGSASNSILPSGVGVILTGSEVMMPPCPGRGLFALTQISLTVDGVLVTVINLPLILGTGNQASPLSFRTLYIARAFCTDLVMPSLSLNSHDRGSPRDTGYHLTIVGWAA